MKNIIQMITLGFLISCGTSTPVTEDLEPVVESTTDLINELFEEADLLYNSVNVETNCVRARCSNSKVKSSSFQV